MWSLSVFLLGCVVVAAGGSYVDELRQKISEASECVKRLVDCSAMYAPVAVNEINGSLFRNDGDLERACQLNAAYIQCVERTRSFCVQQHIGEVEVDMIKNRLFIRDLCAPHSTWRKVYAVHSQCIIRESGTGCGLQQRPEHPFELEHICRYFEGVVKCSATLVKRECGDEAADLLRRISFMKGNREYLCREIQRKESLPLRAAKQLLGNVRSLMAHLSDVVKATVGAEEAAHILHELDPREVKKIRNHFSCREGIHFKETPLFKMEDLIENDHEDDNAETKYYDWNRSHKEDEIEDPGESSTADGSSHLKQIYKSEAIDWPEESLHGVRKSEAHIPEVSLNHFQKDEVRYPEDWSDVDASLQSHQAQEIDVSADLTDADYNEQQKDVESPEKSSDSVQKRVLEPLPDEVSDAIDKNLSQVFSEDYRLSIKDVEEKFSSLFDQKLSDPFQTSHRQISEDFRKEDSSTQPMLADNTSSFIELGFPADLEIADSETGNIQKITYCNTGTIQRIVGTTLKPGVYVDVTSIYPLNFNFDGLFAKDVNCIVVGDPYHPTESNLETSDSNYFFPESKPISVGLLNAESFIKNGIDSICAEKAA